MLTYIKIKNFKGLDEVEFELGKSVVLIGPNNSGKTSALQALALWDIGLKRWNEKNEKRGSKTHSGERPGVTINRRDLISIPVPDANLLWRNLHVRSAQSIDGKHKTQNVRIEIVVQGVNRDKRWQCGLEFDYANDESFYCRPLRVSEEKTPQRMAIPHEAIDIKIAYLPPMSGLADREFIKQTGEIGVLIGQGQTAQVLRNLCHQIYQKGGDLQEWGEMTSCIKRLFGVTVLPPKYIKERSEITMVYTDKTGVQLDISSSGRGLQQTLLLLTHLYANPKSLLLLDEPDAHLEVLRQRETYRLINEIAEKQGSQIIAASHSEIVLNEAADRDIVIAFLGKPHRIDDRGSQVLKALKEIGFDQYYLAEETGWVLYLEGATDLAILQAFAKTLKHEASASLERPFVHYVCNQPIEARRHFYGLKEAYPDLAGIAIFDRLDKTLENQKDLLEIMWKRRELENYLCIESVLLAYARHDQSDDLFGLTEANHRESTMKKTIFEVSEALKTIRRTDPWSIDTKVTDDFLDPLFDKYFEKLNLPNLLRKTDYHSLAELVSQDEIDSDIKEKLDLIVNVAKKAKPRKN